MTRHFFAAISLGFCLSGVCLAQDQVEVINDPPKYLDPVLAPERAELSQQSARALIEKLLGPTYVTDKSYYTIIHVLKWKDNQLVVESQRWYVFNGGSWSKQQFEGTRIFGASHVALLYIHINARGVTPIAKLTEAERRQLDSNTLLSTNSRLLVKFDSDVLIESDYLRVTYRVEVTKKLPAPIQNLSALLALAQADAAKRAVDKVAYYGGREMLISHVPSDVTVRSLLTEGAIPKDTELGKQTFDNEGRYFWDVSVGLPVSKIKELSFDASDGTVRPKEIDRQKLFAMLNIFFKPIDTKGAKPNLFPHLLAGVALSKNPLDRIFVGGGLGLNKVQFFAGVAFNRVATPQTLSTGSSATPSQLEADLKRRYEPKFVFGLNLPVRQVVDALKAKK